jgi:hypothetical protein
LASLLIFLSLPVLTLVATTVSVMSVSATVRAGHKFYTNFPNFVIAACGVGFLLGAIGTFVLDQVPCWIGAPNCD